MSYFTIPLYLQTEIAQKFGTPKKHNAGVIIAKKDNQFEARLARWNPTNGYEGFNGTELLAVASTAEQCLEEVVKIAKLDVECPKIASGASKSWLRNALIV